MTVFAVFLAGREDPVLVNADDYMIGAHPSQLHFVRDGRVVAQVEYPVMVCQVDVLRQPVASPSAQPVKHG